MGLGDPGGRPGVRAACTSRPVTPRPRPPQQPRPGPGGSAHHSNNERTEMRAKMDARNKRRVPTVNRYSTSSMSTLSTSLFNIVVVISSTWTVIRLSAATLLYALLRFDVSNRAPNGCLSRAMTWSARICLSVWDNNEGGRRDAASPGNVVVRRPKGRPRRVTSRAARVCGAADAIPEGPGNNVNSPIEEDRLSVLSSGIISATLPTGCWSRRKSIQG